jgi:predicted RNA-binding protein with PIN domain
MTNKVIIDGWNVCWKFPEMTDLIPDHLEKVRERFNSYIRDYFLGKKVTYKIFYDGQPLNLPKPNNRNSNVIFSTNPQKADDLIVSFLEKQDRQKNWTVITSDRALAQKVKDLGASIISSEEFIAKLKKKKAVRVNDDLQMKKDDISYWLRKFKNRD